MENIQSYFSDIRKHIINELKSADSSIYIAVAWFTDKELFDILCNKAALGLKVELIAIKDEINTTGSIDFTVLLKNGGKVWLVEDQKTMHNKFCVIDKHIVLNGSYNWTYKASDNHENIMIISNHNETTDNYLEQFKQIKIQYFGTEKVAYHKLSLRLAALKNLIQLNDKEDILKQGEKIKNLSLFVYLDQYKKIQSILDLCKNNSFSNAIRIIDELIVEADNFIPEAEIAANTYDNIFDAAEAGSIIGVELFLRKGIDINTQDIIGDSLLHLSCRNNQSVLIKYLINKNINLNLMNYDDFYPIDLINPIDKNNEHNFTLLCSKGAFTNPKKATLANFILYLVKSESSAYVISYINNIKDIDLFVSEVHFEELFSSLVWPGRFEIADLLIKKGVDIKKNTYNLFYEQDFKSYYNFSECVACVRYLIDKGLDWRIYFGSEIFLSIFYRDLDMFKNNLSGSRTLNSLGQTPLYYICLKSYQDQDYIDENFTLPAIKWLFFSYLFLFQISTPDKNGITALENSKISNKFQCFVEFAFDRLIALGKNRVENEPNDRYDKYLKGFNYLLFHIDIKTLIYTNKITEKTLDIPNYPIGTIYNIRINLLGLALQLNDLELAKELIEKGVDVNSYVDVGKLNLFVRTNLPSLIKLYCDKTPVPQGLIYYMSCLEYSKRLQLETVEELLLEKGAMISDSDKRNEHLERLIIIENLVSDKEKREKELEREIIKIELQKVEDQKRKEELEYNNSNFIKKMAINFSKKKKDK